MWPWVVPIPQCVPLSMPMQYCTRVADVLGAVIVYNRVGLLIRLQLE